MKTENTLANKAKLFAQYLGQRVVAPGFETSEDFKLNGISLHPLTINNNGETVTIPAYSLILTGDYSEGICGYDQTGQCDLDVAELSLRPLSSISDEEAIECAKREFTFFKEIAGGDTFHLKVVRERKAISVLMLSADNKTQLAKIPVNDPYKLNIFGIDYYRSIGIALPYHNLSVEDQIAYNWITLRKEGE